MVTPTSDALLDPALRASPRAPDFDYWNDKQGPGPRLMGQARCRARMSAT